LRKLQTTETTKLARDIGNSWDWCTTEVCTQKVDKIKVAKRRRGINPCGLIWGYVYNEEECPSGSEEVKSDERIPDTRPVLPIQN
jgi:hypothetical protein